MGDPCVTSITKADRTAGSCHNGLTPHQLEEF